MLFLSDRRGEGYESVEIYAWTRDEVFADEFVVCVCDLGGGYGDRADIFELAYAKDPAS